MSTKECITDPIPELACKILTSYRQLPSLEPQGVCNCKQNKKKLKASLRAGYIPASKFKSVDEDADVLICDTDVKLERKWTSLEKQLFRQFVEENAENFKSDGRIFRTKESIFNKMSEFIITRNPSSCRHYFQKHNPLPGYHKRPRKTKQEMIEFRDQVLRNYKLFQYQQQMKPDQQELLEIPKDIARKQISDNKMNRMQSNLKSNNDGCDQKMEMLFVYQQVPMDYNPEQYLNFKNAIEFEELPPNFQFIDFLKEMM